MPVVGDNRLRWVLPAKLRPPFLLSADGAETLARDAQKGEQVLEAELGREAALHLHWTPAGTTDAVALQVSELYSWDLRAGYRTATGVLGYTAAGEVRQLEIAVPSALEVR